MSCSATWDHYAQTSQLYSPALSPLNQMLETHFPNESRSYFKIRYQNILWEMSHINLDFQLLNKQNNWYHWACIATRQPSAGHEVAAALLTSGSLNSQEIRHSCFKSHFWSYTTDNLRLSLPYCHGWKAFNKEWWRKAIFYSVCYLYTM